MKKSKTASLSKSKPKKSSSSAGKKAAEKSCAERKQSPKLSLQDKDSLIRQLKTHQLELEEQNDTLRSAQQELKASRRKYADLYDFAPVGYLTFDRNGVIKEINLTGAHLLGMEKQLLLNKPFIQFIDASDLNHFQAHRVAALHTGKLQTCEVRIKRKDESLFYAELQTSAMGIPGEREVFCHTVLSDISERKNFEQLLKESEERYRTLAEFSPEAIAVQQDGKCIYLNRAGLELVGAKDPGEIIGKNIFDFVHARSNSTGGEGTGSLEDFCQRLSERDLKITSLNGQSIEVEAVSTPIIFGGKPASQIVVKDITARKMAEKALRFQANVLSQVRDAVVIIDNEHRIIYWNKGAELLYQYSAAEALGRRLEEVNPYSWTDPDDEAVAYEALSKNGFWRGEGIHLAKNRNSLFVEFSVSILKDESGSCIGLLAVIHDMTKRKQAEQGLRESEERYRSLVESSPEAICVQKNGIVVYLNPTGLELLGASSFEEIKGKKSLAFIRPDFRKTALEWIRDVEGGGEVYPRDLKMLRLNGQEVDIETVARPIVFDGSPAFQIIIKDITDLKNTELRLRLQATVLSQVNDAVIAVGRDRRIIFWNKGAERIYKLTAKEAIGLRREEVYSYRSVKPSDEHPAKESMALTGFVNGENVHILRTGEEIYVESSVSVLTDWSNAPAGWLAVMRDITERRKAERALRESEERQRTIFDNSPSAIFAKDLNSRFILFNRQAEIWSGKRCEEVLGKTDYDLFPKKTADRLMAADRKVIETRNPVVAEEVLVFEDREQIHLDVKFPLFDSSGEMYAICGISTDITERKRAEQAVKEARDAALRERRRLETILNTIPSGLFLTDNSGVISLLNEHASILLGKEIEQEKSTSERISKLGLFRPDGRLFQSEELPNIRAFRTGEAIRDAEIVIERPDKRRITVLSNAAPLRDETGSIVGSITAFNDITERKEMEDALKRVRVELEMRVRERTAELAATVSALQLEIAERKRTAAERDKLVAAVESTAEAVVIADKAGIIEYVNPAFEQITGYQRHEAIGKDLHILDSGQNDKDFFPHMRETIHLHGVWKGRLINKKKDGSLYHEDCTYSPVRDLSGNIVNYVSIKHDVTEKLRLESIAETVDTMNNIGYVFSGIRHEIGNPVSSLLIIMSLLKKKYEASPKESIREYVDQAMAQVERLEYLLTSLKNFNMYENLQIKSIPTSSFMEKFIPLVTSDLAKKGICFQFEAAEEDCWMSADPRALQQALLNIVINASEALAGRPDPNIILSTFKTGGMVRLRVFDNGMGISEDRKKDLFKPFYTTKAHGTGLGLIVTRKLVSRMKGFIEIESRQDNGTHVDIYVPEGTIEYPA